MVLPEYVLRCMERLKGAGFSVYAVGGCVRDSLLGLTPHDYDLCTDAFPEQMRSLFSDFPLITNGEKHGTIGVILGNNVVEITTFRTESGYADRRHPDSVSFVSDIREDLARRDFTVNAMAFSPEEGYLDPFGGQADLKNKHLVAVGDPKLRFREDALRILRGVRFAVKYQLSPEPETLSAMIALAPLMDALARERVFDELNKLLPIITAEDLLQYAPVITQVLPELAPTVGFLQHSPHHEFDVFTHIAKVVEAVPEDPAIRWAALFHDTGKPRCFTMGEDGIGHFYGHADISARLAEQALTRLKAPTALREQAVFLIRHHMHFLEPEKKQLRRALSKYGEDALRQLLKLQRADHGGKGNASQSTALFDQLDALLSEILQEEACLNLKDLAVSGADLIEIGFAPGKDLGACLQRLLEQVLEETLPNDREKLLGYAKDILEEIK